MKMKKPTLTTAKRMLKQVNPEITNLKVSWEHKPTWCEMMGARGTWFWSSVVKVTSDGYKNKSMVLTSDNDGTWIR